MAQLLGEIEWGQPLVAPVVVGDTINVAARVERLTRDLSVDVLITEEVRRELDGRFQIRVMPALPVKGKPEPIVTYLVEGVESVAQTA